MKMLFNLYKPGLYSLLAGVLVGITGSSIYRYIRFRRRQSRLKTISYSVEEDGFRYYSIPFESFTWQSSSHLIEEIDPKLRGKDSYYKIFRVPADQEMRFILPTA